MMMPVSGNQEPGLLFRQTGICSSDIPIKKRRFPFVPSVSEMNDSDNERKSTSNDLSAVDYTSKDSVKKFDLIENVVKEVKKEIVIDINDSSIRTDICRELQAPGSFPPTQLYVKTEVPSNIRVNAELGKSRDEEISPAVISDSVNKVNNCNVSSLGSELATSHGVPKSKLRIPTVNVKTEMVNNRSEGEYKHELLTALGNSKLSLTSNELVDSSLEKEKVGLSTNVPYMLVPPLLPFSLSKAEQPESIRADKTVTDSNVIMSCTDRSNWDLNTTMDAWEGSIEEAASQDISGADELSSSRDTHETKQIVSSTSVVSVRLDKGKRVMEPLEERSTPCISSVSFRDSLLLSLSTSSPEDSRHMPHLISQSPIINSISSCSRTVKSEPVDDTFKPNLSLVLGDTIESLDKGLIYKYSAESYDKNLVRNFQKIIEPTSFKSEVMHDSNQESHCVASFALKRPSSNMVPLQESCSSSSTVSGSVTPQQYFVSKLTTFSEPSGSVGDLDQSEHYSNITEKTSKDIMNPSITSQMPEPLDNYYEDPNACDDGKVYSSETMTFSLQKTDENNIKPKPIDEEPASDKEKISAMVEDDQYGSDYESDYNHAVVSQMARDDGQCEKADDDYEDGEVREFPLKSLVRDPTCDRKFSENSKEADDGCETGAPTTQSTIYEKHGDNHSERIETMTNGNANQLVSDYVSLLVTKSEQVSGLQTEAKAREKFLVNPSVGDIIPGVKEDDLMGDGETRRNDMVLETVSVVRNENEKGINVDRAPDSSLTKEKVTVAEHDSFKDSALGGNRRSRIINLRRASNSPSRFRSLSGRSFTTWSGRERYGDVDGNKLHYRGHRDDTYSDDFKKFSRDRPFRNSRMDFKSDRERGTGRFDSVQKNWDPEHDFPPRSFDVSADYRFNRHRRASAVAENGLRSNDFAVASRGTGPSAGRIGRKPLIDEFHSFRQPSSRRLSPGSRDGTTIRNLPNSRRLPESDSDLAGLRHEIFSRGLPDDITCSVYTRPQASYNEMGGKFVNGNQDYSPVPRRFVPRARSKSPSGTQPRSPGTWPSSRRRFNDDFNNPSDQIQHRSLIYREERMRSPDRVCYTDVLGDRRRASPNYVTRRANEMGDTDFTREQGNLRSISSNRRSSSDRVFPRSTRRLEVLDSRERTDNDKYFSGPIDPGRFHEFRSGGSNDEIRKFGDRRGQFRPCRPSYVEDGSMPLRFCSDQDTESFERSNIRQRGFDGGTKNRPLIAQRQIRGTEDQEGNFGQIGQVWHGESFSDGSRVKKRRF